MAYTDYLDTVQKIYIGYYERPADPAGLLYWAERLDASGGNLDAIIEAFANSAESQALHGEITAANIDEVINDIYQALFGRDAEAGGVTFYHNGFVAGTFTAATIMLNILDGAQNDDLLSVNHKVTAANNFTDVIDPELDGRDFQATYSGDADAVAARDWLADVGVQPASIPTDAETASFIQHNIADVGDPILGAPTDGKTFVLTAETAAGADAMRLTGDQDVRIDFTNPANQVKGLDLDGDGVIENNGVENSITGVAANYEIVDAYSRDRLDETNISDNFLGDIAFDGTGFQGDGVNTNGNIFLGGMGLDIALGGIGNDFLAGGGVAAAREAAFRDGDVGPGDQYYDYYYYDDYGVDEVYGGRNADFFFAELSRLDSTDGNNLYINGGFTSDDAAVGDNTPQDTDWLLLEVSDDEDGAQVFLNDEDNVGGNQYVRTVEGSYIYMDEIENVDASGNLYGFLDDLDVAMGGNGTVVNGENVGIGSSAQLEIIGSFADNTLIGGFDNDFIDGNDGNDLIMGGNLNFLNNPNMLDIPDNGMDELYGGFGDDSIVFEADGGIIDGGVFDPPIDQTDDYGDDTLYVTREALGNRVAAEVLTDGVLRFELENGDEGGDGNDTFAGYGGADVDFTADQTNYVSGGLRVDVDNMDNVIATGMGAVDYLAAGTNDPELVFNNQQNHFGYTGDLDLRGTDGSNILYANTGDDVVEGREGDDLLSGGDGRDDFYFQLAASGDGVDVIHRQADADDNNIWDGGYAQDFGIGGVTQEGASFLTVDFNGSNLALPGVAVTQFDVTVDGVLFSGGDSATLSAFTSLEDLAAELNAVFNAQDSTVSVSVTGDTIIVTKSDGGVFGTDIATGTIVAGVATNGLLETDITATDELDVTTPDRLIFKSYEDRSDNEGVDDDAVTGSSITLGQDAYAEDTVVSFAADGTRIAEDQQYVITFDNLTTEDVVTINVNGVTYQLQVGVSVDGTQVDDEDGVLDTQAGIQEAFLSRFAGFINSFMDDDTAAGSISAAATATTLTINQNAYSDGEETVFMTRPVVDISNLSGGERATARISNTSDSEIFLLDYAGTNNDDERLTEDNVLFIGEEGVENSRAVLATALIAGGDLTGSDALVINGGVDDLIGVASNLATDDELQTDRDDDGSIGDEANNGNFVVHGDDYLIGGVGNDTITGGTGDDRIRGSLGTDAVDGGKDLYAVREVGETKYAVETLNAYEAEQRDADPDVTDIYLLEQTESADVMIEGDNFAPYFQDTLIFHQADFTAGATEFTINLNNYLTAPGQIILDEGGAGTVSVDVDGDGDFESVTSFTNFEHIRTVSGVDRAVAGDGQGNDTLILTGLSDDSFVGNVPGGVFYDLTNGASAGLVEVHWDEWVDLNANGQINVGELFFDHAQDIMFVDGVENIIAGDGHDLVDIDETEAAKDNFYDGGDDGVLGDSIDYHNDFGDPDVEPTVTIVVEAASDTDEVIMTAGRVGQTVATDTLVDVEHIGLFDDTAGGIRENDVIDVTNAATDVLVDFVNEEVSTDANNDGDFADPGELLVTIENMYQMENVLTDANDTVLVGDADYMSQNTRSDTESRDLIIDTYLNYDLLDPGLNRESVADMRANGEIFNDIPEARNFEQFTFDLGQATDRVDYSNADDQIAAVVAVNAGTNYVLVNGGDEVLVPDDPDTIPDETVLEDPDFIIGPQDRVDALIGVEEIAASTGESILDFTTLGQDVQVSFQFDTAGIDVAKDRLESLIRIADGDGNEIAGIPNFIEYYDLDDDDDVDPFFTAAWTRIEGSDFGEAVFYDGSEDLVNLAGVDHRYTDDVLTLRGGENNVSYFALETSISASIDVTEFDGANPLTTGLIDTTITFQDGSGGALPGGGTHEITSYTGDNGIAAGSLKLEASQDAEDSVTFVSLSEKVFILGQSPGVISVEIGDLDAMVLTGFEVLLDAPSDDVYDMADLSSVFGNLTLVDNASADYDTIKVGDDAIGFDTAPADTISLEVLNDAFLFDFNALDITNVTDNNLLVVGDTDTAGAGRDIAQIGGAPDLTLGDDLVVGNLDLIDSVTLFDRIVFTDASITSAGNEYVLDMDAFELQDGSAALFTTDAFLTELDFSRVTSGVTVSVVDTAAVGAIVIGGAGDDTITGGAGADTIEGGPGSDILAGGFVPEVQEVQQVVITGAFGADGSNDGTIDIGGITLTEAAAAVPGVSVVDGSSNIQIGAAFDAIAEADWEIALGLAAGQLDNVSFDAITGALSFTFAAGFDAVDGSVLTASGGYTANTDTGAVVIGAGTDVAYAAEADSIDTFVFGLDAVGGVDTITDFDSTLNGTIDPTLVPSLVDDLIDFTALGLTGGVGGFGGNPVAALSNGDAMVADSYMAFFDATAQTTTLYADVNDDGFYNVADDVTVVLVGVDNAPLASILLV